MPGRGQAHLVCHMLPVTGRHVTRRPAGAAATIGPVALPGHPIETARLALRPFTPDDFDDLYAYQSRPEVARYLHWEARDRAQVRQALEDQCRETSLDAEGDWLTFAVQWREAGRGGGLATEAATAMLDLGFSSLGWHRVIGCCDARNEASARLMERIGMRREAHFVHSEIVKCEWADELVFAILDHEWTAR